MMEAAGSTPPVSSLLYNWDFTKSMTDTIGGVTAQEYGSGGQTSDGFRIAQSQRYLLLPNVFDVNRTYWATFTEFNTRYGGTNLQHGRILMADNDANTSTGGNGFVFRNQGYMTFYTGGSWNDNTVSSADKYDYFANSTLKMYVDADGMASVYRNKEFVVAATKAISLTLRGKHAVFGGSSSDTAAYMTITSVQIYDGFVI